MTMNPSKTIGKPMQKDKTRHEKALDAEERGNRWLADGNAAREAGNTKKAERCYAKGQFWLDRYNKLTDRA